MKLLQLRDGLRQPYDDSRKEFFILRRARMRMGFHCNTVCLPQLSKIQRYIDSEGIPQSITHYRACCPKCFKPFLDDKREFLSPGAFHSIDERNKCKVYDSPLWTLKRPKKETMLYRNKVQKAMCQIPTIGAVTANRLIQQFDEDFLSNMLADNIFEFINLINDNNNFVFTDRQARRMERDDQH